MFSCEYCEYFQNTYFEEHLLTAAFDFLKQLWVDASVVTQINACTQTAICFFTAKYKILKTVPKRAFRFLQGHSYFPQGNTKSDYLLSINACTQTAIRFLTVKYKVLKLYPNGHSSFLQQNTKFESYTQTAIRFLSGKYKIWKLYPNGHLFFLTTKPKILKTTPKRLSLCISFFTTKYRI